VLLWVVLVGLRLGRGPNDKRETPDELSRGMCLLVLEEMLLWDSDGAWRDWEGVSEAKLAALEEAVDPPVRLRLRMVMLDGIAMPRGEERGGDSGGGAAGSLERADCTRASNRCI
jgi:hypothetical protein